jgi:hypothetical protein
MKTLIFSALMMIFTVQLSHAGEVSKSHSDASGSPRIIREIR